MTSRRQWTRMFMTKHTCNQDCKTPCPRSPHYTPPAEERTSKEPKPRWSPTPEQIQILQSTFNSGIITPTREEIRNLRNQLQEYGEVGEANVFYWFQNRKSRNKNKKRQSTNSQTKTRTAVAPPTTSYSDAYPKLPAPTEDTYLSSDHFLLAGQLEGFNFSDQAPWPNVPFGSDHQTAGGDSEFLTSEMMMGYPNDALSYKNVGDQLFNYSHGDNNFTLTPTTNSVATATTTYQTQGIWEESAPAVGSSTVFINDTAVEVGFERINVGEVFGDDAVLIDSSGNPVFTDDWGFSLQPLQHGAFYNLLHWGAC